MPDRPFAGFLLVGGQSSRMGCDKALLPLGGEPLAARLAARVQQATGSATLVGSRDKYAHLGWPVIEDLVPGLGPLAGIHAALKQTGARWNLVTGCDLPFLTVAFLRFLLETAAGGDEQAIVPVGPGGQFELAAVLRDDCLPAIEEALRAGQHKLAGVYEQLRTRQVPPREWQRFDRRGILFHNVNTPEEFEKAVKSDE